MKTWIRRPCINILENELGEATSTRMRFYQGLHRRIARSNARQVVRTYTCINVSQKSAESHEDRTEAAALNTHGKYSSTYIYVHKCVAEECRIARRLDRNHCTQYSQDVGSNSLHSRCQDPAARNKIFSKYTKDHTARA